MLKQWAWLVHPELKKAGSSESAGAPIASTAADLPGTALYSIEELGIHEDRINGKQ